MDIQTLCMRIALPEQMAHRVDSFSRNFDFSSVAAQMERMMSAETAQTGYQELADALGDDPDGVKILTCQLRCACSVYERYVQMGIPESVFFNTMSCFTRFIIECSYYKGAYLFDRGWWTWRQISMQVFRLGELEYELRPDETVAIHIPTGTAFTPQNVEHSLLCARQFFAKFFPQYAGSDYTCRSWLLSPALGTLLEESSNILSFQRRFKIVAFDPQNMDYVPWVFQTIPGAAPESYAQKTSLQRKVKAFVLDGGMIGTAFGVLK